MSTTLSATKKNVLHSDTVTRNEGVRELHNKEKKDFLGGFGEDGRRTGKEKNGKGSNEISFVADSSPPTPRVPLSPSPRPRRNAIATDRRPRKCFNEPLAWSSLLSGYCSVLYCLPRHIFHFIGRDILSFIRPANLEMKISS